MTIDVAVEQLLALAIEDEHARDEDDTGDISDVEYPDEDDEEETSTSHAAVPPSPLADEVHQPPLNNMALEDDTTDTANTSRSRKRRRKHKSRAAQPEGVHPGSICCCSWTACIVADDSVCQHHSMRLFERSPWRATLRSKEILYAYSLRRPSTATQHPPQHTARKIG